MTAKAAIAILLLTALAAVFAGCGGIAGSIVGNAPATNPAAQPPPPAIATAVAQAEATVQASYAKSQTDYCGRLCQPSFWLNATVADLDAEISKGTAVNAKGGVSGGAPLHYAVRYADIFVIAALLDRGADLEAKDDNGFTALHTIVSPPGYIDRIDDLDVHRHSGHGLEVAALLLERGADANANTRSGWGDSPVGYANDPVMAVLLLNYGADRETACENMRPVPLPTFAPWQQGVAPPPTPTPYPTPTYTPIEALVCP